MKLEDILEPLIKDAKEERDFYSTAREAMFHGIKEGQLYSLYAAPLTDGPHDFDLGWSDIVVGFIANTDAEFRIMPENCTGHEGFPVTMKKGEFQLAWRGQSILPLIRLVYHRVYYKDIKGSVRIVGALLEDDMRRELVQRQIFPLDAEGSISVPGMIGIPEKK
jgi:hypothetical protein